MYTKESFKQEAKYTIIDFLKDGYSGYLCDMHNEIFNTEHYPIRSSTLDCKRLVQ